jgi:hypothetical protein
VVVGRFVGEIVVGENVGVALGAIVVGEAGCCGTGCAVGCELVGSNVGARVFIALSAQHRIDPNSSSSSMHSTFVAVI